VPGRTWTPARKGAELAAYESFLFVMRQARLFAGGTEVLERLRASVTP
jgi:hypothetical protein